MSKQDRKDAILKVLAQHIDAKSYPKLAGMWETEFSDKPQFGMVEFLKVLYESTKMPLSKGDLIKEFNKALLTVRNNKRNGAPPASGLQNAFFEVFKIMYMEITRELEPNQNNQLTDQQFELLQNDKSLDNRNVQQLVMWMRNRGGPLNAAGLGDITLKQAFSKAYFYSCEIFGPFQADIHLSNTLALASKSQFSKLASPTDMLAF